MRLLLDTDVVVAAMRSPMGASAELLRLASRGQITLLLTVALALEYETVCLRAEHRLASGLSEGEVMAFVNGLIAIVEPVLPRFRWRPQLRDPADEIVLEAAVNGQAEAIVTFNVKDYGRVPQRFGIAVLLPREALMRKR